MLINKIFTYKKKRFWAGLLLAQFLLFFIFSKIDFVIELFEHFFELRKKIHQQIFSWIPFSVGDIFYIILFFSILYFLIKILNRKSRNLHLRTSLILVNIFYFIYQLSWGMMYFQKPISEKIPQKEITLEQTKELALKYLESCKKTRLQVNEDQNGVFKIYDLKEVEDEIIKQQNFLPKNINTKTSTEFNSFKPSLYKGIMSYTGIFGYYNPFTAEAQFNSELPSSFVPFTLAHESSHQMGYAREQEANFIGYLIGKDSKNPDLKYSTEYFVLKSLLNSLVEKQPEFVKGIVEQYSEGMKRDRITERRFTEEHAGILDAIFGFTNDLFLKSNQQEGSITYTYFVELLIRYEISDQHP